MRKLLFLFVTFGTLLFSTNALCDDFLFVTLEYPPLEYVGKEGRPTGIAVEVVTTIMKRLGHTVSIRVYPWTRAIKMTKEGRADAIFTAYKNPQRETFLDYSKGVLASQQVYLYKKKESQIDFQGDLGQLRAYRIGVVSTISYGQKFDKAKPMLKVERVHKLEQNFDKMLKGRIDLVVSNVYSGDYVLKQMHYQDRIVKLPTVVQDVPSYIAFSKKKGLTRLRDQFDVELAKMKQSGEYDTIMKKYGIVLP